MTIKTRLNKNTNKTQYKCRYYFKSYDGVRHDSETGWFDTKKEAEDEAKRLKSKKESEDWERYGNNGEKLLSTVFDEFTKYLSEENKTAITTSFKSYFYTASAIKNHYIPESIAKRKIKNITPTTFYNWLDYINGQETIGGKYVRSCKLILNKFSEYLQTNNYYENIMQNVNNKSALNQVRLKNVEVHNKERAKKRFWIDIGQLNQLVNYYRNSLGTFRNFYWYTFFYVLFFSGMRVEEIVALKWKCVDFNDGSITIDDSITKMEESEKVYKRLSDGIKKTKNDDSVRTIPILNIYYTLLIDYCNSYRYQYNITIDEMQDCFVFPNLASKSPKEYQKHDNIANELQKVIKAQKLPKTDAQMFRHSCAYFLIEKPPKGLGYERSKVYLYFGHSNENMLREVYGRFNKKQKTETLFANFSEVASVHKKSDEEIQRDEEIKKLTKMVIKGDEKETYNARKDRIYAQIEFIIQNTQRRIYYYSSEDKKIIEDYRKDHPNPCMNFEEEDQKLY